MPNPFRRKPKVSVDDFSDFLEPRKEPLSSEHMQKVRDSMKKAFMKATDKDTAARGDDHGGHDDNTGPLKGSEKVDGNLTRMTPSKDTAADARDRAKEAERTRNRKGGAGYDPTDTTESFANRVFARLEEKMDPRDHAVKRNGKFVVVDKNGKVVKTFDDKKSAEKYALGNHDDLMSVDESAWQRKEGKNKEGGLNEKGRKAYERENPGSNLKAPVSAAQAKKSKGGKAAKRRKSFCARMSGMPGPMKDEKGRPTRKALSLRKWDC